jgi:hypothetical protein
MNMNRLCQTVLLLIVAVSAVGTTNSVPSPNTLLIDDMESRKGADQANLWVSAAATGGVLLIDDMEGKAAPVDGGRAGILANPGRELTGDSIERNMLGGRTGVYQQGPSQAEATKGGTYGKMGAGLRIYYNKKGKGGPRDDGGFCGYYSLLHQHLDDYLDASQYDYITFWVKGAKGGENFKLGAADRKWHLLDDTVKIREIGNFLPEGKITTEWQRAVIPTREFGIDWKQAHAIAICFEGDLYQGGAGYGVIFIDELALTKDQPAPAQELPETPDTGDQSNKPNSKTSKRMNPRQGTQAPPTEAA